MQKQRTLKHSVKAMGVGLHTGRQIHLTLSPAPADTGIVFRRVDLNPQVSILAHPNSVGDTQLATTLVQNGVRIGTVEHLLSAFSGFGIDNVFVDVDAEEIPIMDGSAGIFVFLIESAGIKEQTAPKRFILIKKSVAVQSGDKKARFEPFSGSKFSLEVDFSHPAIQGTRQSISIHVSRTSYIKEVSRARTFGFLSEIDHLKANNFALGGSLDNAMVFDHEKLINEGGFRYKDEVVRHKLLDAIGDVYVLGCTVIGEYLSYKSGHTLNNELLRALLMDPSAWEYTHSAGL
jgi:UDP-3-O-[3-hydroxymyristoyl] N-acetylglucosamine deacetylase